jgi:hypothetical protein
VTGSAPNPEEVYDLFRRGSDLLERGDFAAATIPLERARTFEPDKTSIRARSSPPSSSAHRSTTTRTSAWAARSR